MGGERELKECPICLDGVEYPKNVGECPKCKNFLRMKKSSAKVKVDDDFADVFDNTLYEEEKTHLLIKQPILLNLHTRSNKQVLREKR